MIRGAIRMPSSRSGILHLDNGEGYPACAGHYGNTPGTEIPQGTIDCRKCVQIMEDLGAETKTESTPAATINITTTVADKPGDYSVTFQLNGQSIIVPDVKANGPQDAVAAAYSRLNKTVAQQQIWMVE